MGLETPKEFFAALCAAEKEAHSQLQQRENALAKKEKRSPEIILLESCYRFVPVPQNTAESQSKVLEALWGPDEVPEWVLASTDDMDAGFFNFLNGKFSSMRQLAKTYVKRFKIDTSKYLIIGCDARFAANLFRIPKRRGLVKKEVPFPEHFESIDEALMRSEDRRVFGQYEGSKKGEAISVILHAIQELSEEKGADDLFPYIENVMIRFPTGCAVVLKKSAKGDVHPSFRDYASAEESRELFGDYYEADHSLPYAASILAGLDPSEDRSSNVILRPPGKSSKDVCIDWTSDSDVVGIRIANAHLSPNSVIALKSYSSTTKENNFHVFSTSKFLTNLGMFIGSDPFDARMIKALRIINHALGGGNTDYTKRCGTIAKRAKSVKSLYAQLFKNVFKWGKGMDDLQNANDSFKTIIPSDDFAKIYLTDTEHRKTINRRASYNLFDVPLGIVTSDKVGQYQHLEFYTPGDAKWKADDTGFDMEGRWKHPILFEISPSVGDPMHFEVNERVFEKLDWALEQFENKDVVELTIDPKRGYRKNVLLASPDWTHEGNKLELSPEVISKFRLYQLYHSAVIFYFNEMPRPGDRKPLRREKEIGELYTLELFDRSLDVQISEIITPMRTTQGLGVSVRFSVSTP